MAIDYAFLTQIRDPILRNVAKILMDRVTTVEQSAQAIGTVTKPLTTHLDAGSNRLTNLADPTADADAVTRGYLQKYLDDRLASAGLIDASGQPMAAPVAAGCTPATTHPPLTGLDTTTMTAAYTASFRGLYGRDPTGVAGSGIDDTGYWVGVSNHYGKFSDGICRAGWNRYWETILGGAATADPALGDLPAVYLP